MLAVCHAGVVNAAEAVVGHDYWGTPQLSPWPTPHGSQALMAMAEGGKATAAADVIAAAAAQRLKGASGSSAVWPALAHHQVSRSLLCSPERLHPSSACLALFCLRCSRTLSLTPITVSHLTAAKASYLHSGMCPSCTTLQALSNLYHRLATGSSSALSSSAPPASTGPSPPAAQAPVRPRPAQQRPPRRSSPPAGAASVPLTQALVRSLAPGLLLDQVVRLDLGLERLSTLAGLAVVCPRLQVRGQRGETGPVSYMERKWRVFWIELVIWGVSLI